MAEMGVDLLLVALSISARAEYSSMKCIDIYSSSVVYFTLQKLRSFLIQIAAYNIIMGFTFNMLAVRDNIFLLN